MLSLGTIILQQGKRGVPVGEFLSNQVAKIGCAWHEYRSLLAPPDPSSPALTFESDVWQALNGSCMTPNGVPLSIPPPPRWGLHMPRVWRHIRLFLNCPGCRLYPCLTLCTVHGCVRLYRDFPHYAYELAYNQRFTGMWAPVDQPFSFLTLGDMPVILACTSHWDGAAEGRIQKIIAHTPQRDRSYAREFLQKLDPLHVVMGEVVTPQPWTPPLASACLYEDVTGPRDGNAPMPVVLFSRYRDNVYIAFVNVPECMHDCVRDSVAVVLRQIYGIPLKWEPQGTSVTSGEASLDPCEEGGFSLTRKGIVRDISMYDPKEPVEWTHWVNRFSPSAHTVWRSQFPPSVVLKSISYALSVTHLCLNIRSLIWYMGFHSYPKSWWRPKHFSLWSKYRMGQCFSMHEIDQWFAQGTTISHGVVGVEGSMDV